MAPTYLLLTHTTDIWIASLLLVPAAISIFMPYSPIVVLGQTYLARNAGRNHAGTDNHAGRCFRAYGGVGGGSVGISFCVADFLDCGTDWAYRFVFSSGTGTGMRSALWSGLTKNVSVMENGLSLIHI